MDDFPSGNPKYSRIKATYSEPPVRRQPTPEPPDRARNDFAVVGVGILVIVGMYLLATNWPVR